MHTQSITLCARRARWSIRQAERNLTRLHPLVHLLGILITLAAPIAFILNCQVSEVGMNILAILMNIFTTLFGYLLFQSWAKRPLRYEGW